MEVAIAPKPETKLYCRHCGDLCGQEIIKEKSNHFCCSGCQIIYSVLHENGLSHYYSFEQQPGVSQKSKLSKDFTFLDDPTVVEKLLEFQENNLSKISFQIPQIHCSSCVWLLENIQKLHPGILYSRVDFLKKSAAVTFNPTLISLRKVVELLSKIGYEPELNLHKLDEPKTVFVNRSLIYKLGLAGFSFGNIMLLSFPEYLGFEESDFRHYLGYVNILLSIPVVLYSGFDYLRSAWFTIKLKLINIDIPIAIGILTLFGRSTYEILSGNGEGYLDSLVGFIFFLLIGKWFQNYTFASISFDRNYKSYFPISALVLHHDKWQSKTLDKIVTGDKILIKNEEIIPADAIIEQGEANLDYSFVTGESDIVRKMPGDKVFAGGKHVGKQIILKVLKKVDQSYLSSLWDEDSFSMDKRQSTQMLIHKIGKYFTVTILIIAVITLVYWLVTDKSTAFNSFTAVLIVACPCALSLAIPFTYGNLLRLAGSMGFYIKNVETIERTQQTDLIIFDKTGTITDHQKIKLSWKGKKLSSFHKSLVKSLAFQSGHPLSKAIFSTLESTDTILPDTFEEKPGAGLTGTFGLETVRIGSHAFIFGNNQGEDQRGVYIQINEGKMGFFEVSHQYRAGLNHILKTLSEKFPVQILSGDHLREKNRISADFPFLSGMKFQQSPLEKLNHIKAEQQKGYRVLMIGDGLNDAGALKQADVGVVISDQSNNFTPACDIIVDAKNFEKLLPFLLLLKKTRILIWGAFLLALTYNIIGLWFAVQGLLSPVVAAILMPVSSVSVMGFGMLSSHYLFSKYLKHKTK